LLSDFEKAFVNLVNRRICIRIVKFCLSTNEVEINRGSGFPLIGVDTTSVTRGGE